MRDGFLEASFEIYGNENQSDLEIIDSIYPSEFPKILELFGLSAGTEILDAIKQISASGQGERFKKLVRDKTIKAKHFSWMTDRD
jgi:hypothetical protein